MTNGFFSSYTPLPRHQNARAEAVNAIFDAVIVGFDGVPAAAATQQDRVTHCTDTGAADAYVIAPTYAIVSYTAGQHYSFVATHANTMASTVNVSALGVKTIKRQDGTDLSAGDIASGQMVEIRYDGTNFQLLSMPSGSVAASAASATAAASSATAAASSATASAASATQATASATTAGATVSQWAVAAGTADAITATFPTTVTSLTDGLVLGFRASAANATTTPTFKADGTTAHTITRNGGVALAVGDIRANGEYFVRYNLANTRWEMENPGAALLSTRQVLTSGSGATYTTPAGCRQLRVRMVGGGGGGGRNSSGGTNGGTGGTTTFNSINAVGGGGGNASDTPGSGGTGGTGGTAPNTTRFTGQAGSTGILGANGGGSGGSSIFGGGALNNTAAAANSGGGGGGEASASGNSGGGGGGGEGVEIIISSPSATYTYTVGAGGAATASAGAGGSGEIIVDEYY